MAAIPAMLAMACPGAAIAQPGPSAPLCRTPEVVLFNCEVEARTVSICGREGQDNGAVYRFGRPGNVELEAANVHFAQHPFAGGGEAQVYADTPTDRYIVYERTARTAFGADGQHDPQEVSGLVVQSAGRTLSNRECAQPATFDPRTGKLVAAGDYVPH